MLHTLLHGNLHANLSQYSKDDSPKAPQALRNLKVKFVCQWFFRLRYFPSYNSFRNSLIDFLNTLGVLTSCSLFHAVVATGEWTDGITLVLLHGREQVSIWNMLNSCDGSWYLVDVQQSAICLDPVTALVHTYRIVLTDVQCLDHPWGTRVIFRNAWALRTNINFRNLSSMTISLFVFMFLQNLLTLSVCQYQGGGDVAPGRSQAGACQ